MRRLLLLALPLAAASAGAGISTNVSFSAAAYAPGEALSAKGTVGGAWEIPAGLTPTNVVTDGVGGIDFATARTNGCELVASSAGEANDFRQIDFRIDPARLSDCPEFTPESVAALTPGLSDDGSFCFFGWGDGAWQELYAVGDVQLSAPLRADWVDGRIEMKTVADVRHVSYLVKVEGAWTRLTTFGGRAWFATRREQMQTTCGVAGTGRLASLAATSDAEAAPTTYYWIGGAAGDWNIATNWSETAGGEPAGRCPAAGDAAYVSGSAELVRGDEAATVTNFLALVREDGTLDLWSGAFQTAVTFDTSRVRAGKKLEIVVAPFGGLVNDIAATWSHAPMASGGKKGGYTQVATGASYAPQKADYESWFKCDYSVGRGPVETKEFFFSKLPVLYLTTDDGKTPTAEKEKHDGWVTVQGNDEFKSQYDGRMTINVRGNTTSNQLKKPWKLKLDEKTKMFGIEGKSKHWVLLANAMDATGWRNKICYDFAGKVDTTGMDSTFVTCLLNGAYQGLYQFCEQVRIGAGRVDISDWESAGEDVAKALVKGAKLPDEAKDALKDEMSEDFQWVTSGRVTYDGVTYDLGEYVKDFASYTNDISGGYLYELDGKSGDALTKLSVSCNGAVLAHVEGPETLYTNTRMKGKAQTMLQDVFDASTSVDGYKDGKAISEIADIDSLVGYFLAMEMTANYDAANNSRFAYKEKGQPVVFGPVWDCDLALGSKYAYDAWGASRDPRGWVVAKKSFYKEWADDPAFCTRLWRTYWAKARAAYQAGIETVDQLQADLKEPLAANTVKWGNVDKEPQKDAADFVKTYMTERLAWLDEQFADVPTLMASLKTSGSAHPYVKDDESLAIDVRRSVQGPYAKVTVANAAVAKVAVYLDGLKVGGAQIVGADGTVRVDLPGDRLGRTEDSCLEVIAYAADGKTVAARNYLLARRPKGGFAVIIQ